MREALSLVLAATLLSAPGQAAAQDVVPPPTGAPDAAARGPAFPGGYRLEALESSDRAPVGEGAPLTLQRVLASVERHHPSLESARAQVRAAQGEQLAAEGGFDLSLSARGWAAPEGYYDWGRADIALDQPTPLWGTSVSAGWRIGRGGDIPGYYGNYETLDLGELRAQVRVPLWRDGPIDARRARIWRAEHATDAEQASLDARRLSMQLDAVRAYWEWVAAGQRYRVAASLLDLAEQRDVQIASRVAAGAIPAIESLENRRAVLSRRTSLVSARRALERSAIALSLYLRRDDGSPRVPRPESVPLVTEDAPLPQVNLRAEVEAAWERRPEMERYRALVRRQRVSVDQAENQFAPRIDLTVGASVDLGAGTPEQQAALGPAVVEGSVLVSLPLQFREARGGIERTSAELAALRADARFVREQIGVAVQDAYSAVLAADEQRRLASQSADVANAVAEAERRRFELGATPLFIVNLREQAAAEAAAVLVDARALTWLAYAQFQTATGTGVSGAR